MYLSMLLLASNYLESKSCSCEVSAQKYDRNSNENVDVDRKLRLKWISYHKYANAIRYSMCWLEAAKEHCKANKWNSHLIERWNVPITANHLIQLRMHQNHWLHHSQAIYLRPEWRITRNFVFAWNYCIKCWNSWKYSFLRLHLSGFAWIWLILRCKRFDVCFRISIYPVNQTVLRRVSNVMNFDKCVSEKCRRKENLKRKSNNVSYLKYTEYMRIKRDYTTNANQIEAHGVQANIAHTAVPCIRTNVHTHTNKPKHTHTLNSNANANTCTYTQLHSQHI